MLDETMDAIIARLRTVYDPDLGNVNIYDLGLIYQIAVTETKVDILMTLTSPGCPSADYLISKVTTAAHVEGITSVNVDITFNPPWSIENIEESLKYDLGLL